MMLSFSYRYITALIKIIKFIRYISDMSVIHDYN